MSSELWEGESLIVLSVVGAWPMAVLLVQYAEYSYVKYLIWQLSIKIVLGGLTPAHPQICWLL